MVRSIVFPVQLLVVAAILVSGLPLAEGAKANDTTAYGCTITAKKPRDVAGDVVANATVECSQSLPGRIVVTELLQERIGGSYEPVLAASATLQVPEELEEPPDGDPYEADGNPVSCRQISGTSKFRTVVKAGDGNGNFEEIASGPEELNLDCLEGDQMRAASVSADEVVPEGCTGEVCSETHLEKRDEFYGCDVRSRNPFKQQNRLHGEGRFNCGTPMVKRLLYAKLCDNFLRFVDPCTGLTSRYINRGNRNWTATPNCIATPVTASPPWVFEFKGTYTRTGIDPRRQGNGNNPADRHLNSPETNVGLDCVVSSGE